MRYALIYYLFVLASCLVGFYDKINIIVFFIIIIINHFMWLCQERPTWVTAALYVYDKVCKKKTRKNCVGKV